MSDQIIHPDTLEEMQNICHDLAERKIPFVMRYNAGGITIRILAENVSAV